MKSQIELLGILHLVYSGIGIVLAIGVLVVLSGIGWFSGDATAMGILGILGIVGAMFLGVLSIPGIIAGIGLLKLRPWSRILAIIVSCFHLLNFPFGTALGVYSFYVLLNDETIRMLSPEPVAAGRDPVPANS